MIRSLKNFYRQVLRGLRQEEPSSVLVLLVLVVFLLTLVLAVLRIESIQSNSAKSLDHSRLQYSKNMQTEYSGHHTDVICSTPHVVNILKDTLQLSTQTEPAEFKQLHRKITRVLGHCWRDGTN